MSEREWRKPPLGLKAQESGTYLLTIDFTKSVSSVYRYLKQLQQDLASDIKLDALY